MSKPWRKGVRGAVSRLHVGGGVIRAIHYHVSEVTLSSLLLHGTRLPLLGRRFQESGLAGPSGANQSDSVPARKLGCESKLSLRIKHRCIHGIMMHLPHQAASIRP
jgi:hypothetical protein